MVCGRLLPFALFVTILGCKRFGAPPPSSNVEATFAGSPAKLTYGVATPSEHALLVELSTHPRKCGDSGAVASEKRLTLSVPRAPHGSLLVGGPTDVVVELFDRSTRVDTGQRWSSLEVEPFTGKKGEMVRGKLRVRNEKGADEASGSFSVMLCEDTAATAAPVFAAHPAIGTLVGAPFTAKHAIAWVANVDGVRRIEEVQLFSSDVPCRSAGAREWSEPVLTLSGIGGASEKNLLLGAAQRVSTARASLHKKPPGSPPDGSQWTGAILDDAIRFDALELTPGSALKGAILIDEASEDGKKTALDGTFEGKVCERDQPYPAPTPSAEITAELAGAKHSLRYATANVSLHGVSLSFTEAPYGCGSTTTPFMLRVQLPPGPGRRFFAGAPVRVMSMLTAEGESSWLPDGVRIPMELEIAPFALAEGAHVKGSLAFDAKVAASTGGKPRYVGKGSFDTTLCDDTGDAMHDTPMFPEQIADAGAPHSFATGSSVAYVVREDGVDRVDRIVLFAAAGVTCATAGSAEGARVTLDRAAWSAPLRLGSPQPVEVLLEHAKPPPVNAHPTFGWTWIDAAKLAPAGRVEGRFYAADEKIFPPWPLSGRFDAQVCPSK